MDIEKPQDKEEKTEVTGTFEEEIYMDKNDAADFLEELASELRAGNEIKITTEDWELPFTIRDKVEIEVELEKDELEIEFEFEKDKSKDLSVK